MCENGYTPREIPSERKDYGTNFSDEIKLKALFNPSVKYQLIEAYGLNCYTETEEGLLFEFGFENRSFLLSWLLSFGDKVKVIEPDDIISEIEITAVNILRGYKKYDK